jgi:hypothetical protein
MEESAIDIQTSPKNSTSMPKGRIYELYQLYTKLRHIVKVHIWNPVYNFSVRIWNRVIAYCYPKEEPTQPDSVNPIGTIANNGETTLVNRTKMTEVDEKVQQMERELSEISVMRITHSTSISSLIREDYVDSSGANTN